MNTGARISVAMITMNEAASVATVIQHIQAVVPDAEILLVDSSRDETPAIAARMGARVIRQFPPAGYGPAMMRALKACTREVIVTLDCDNTYPAEKIPELANFVLENTFDLVDASRLQKKPAAMPWINYLANVFFAFFASGLFQRRFTDLHSGMRAYRKSMLDALEFESRGAALPVELLIKPVIRGYRFKTVYIEYRDRTGQSTLQPLDSAWWTLKRIVRLRYRRTH